MFRSFRHAIYLAAALFLVSACGSRTNLPAAQSDQPLSNTQLLTDIPVPQNATLDNERSLILADRDRWVGRVVMRFWQSTSELTGFYQAQMPSFGWEPVMSVTSATSVLSFVRGDRAATVQIEDSALGLKSQVSITVAPRQAGAPASSAPNVAPAPAPGLGGTDSGAYTRQPVKTETLPPSGQK